MEMAGDEAHGMSRIGKLQTDKLQFLCNHSL